VGKGFRVERKAVGGARTEGNSGTMGPVAKRTTILSGGAAALAALLSGCGDEPEVRAAAGPEPLAVSWGGGHRLVAYSWASGGRVELPPGGVTEARRLTYGELGRTPATEAYLRFEDDLQRELAGYQRLRGRAEGGRPAEGRFGQGLELGSEERLHLLLPDPLAHNHWTLEAWVRPLAGAGVLFEVPGVLRLAADEQGILTATLRSLPETTLRAARPLARGSWNHVGVVVDARDLDHLRLVVNGEGARADFREPMAPEVPSEFLVGAMAGEGTLPCVVDEVRFQSRPAATCELIDHHARPDRRQPDELLLDYADGTSERLELWPRPLTSSTLANATSLEGVELRKVVADGDGLRWVAGDFEELPALDPPTPRTTHPTIELGDGKVFVFGGETLDSHFGPFAVTDDTWLFDTRSYLWTRLDTPQAPEARCHQGSAYSPDHGIVLYAGGFRNDRDPVLYFRDTWAFVVDEGRWEPRAPIPRKEGLANAGLEYLPRLKRFALLHYGQVYLYDPELDEWETHNPRAVDEEGRPADYAPWASPITGYDPATGTVVIFGGGRGSEADREYTDRTAIYDPERDVYVVLAPGESPSPRVRGAFAYDSARERFVLFGGVQAQFSERERDLWTFDPGARRWTRHEASDLPIARGGYYGMAYDERQDRFFILCGRHAPHRFLNDSLALTLDERAPGTARLVFDRRGAEPGERWFHQADTPGTSRVGFRFRTSADGRAFGPSRPLEEVDLDAADFVQVEATLWPGERGEVPRLLDFGFTVEG